MPQPYKVFIVYAREDAQYLSELLGQLRPLEIAGRIQVWSDREINPGVEWEKALVQQLDTADVILLLVSGAYYSSAYIHEVEIRHAIQRHERDEARVLPVIVRPCSFLDDPDIRPLQVLPTDGKAVNDRRHWHDRDDAWVDVIEGLKRTLDLMRDAEFQREQATEREKEAAQQARKAAVRRKREAAEQEELERLTQRRREQEQADLAAYRKREIEARITDRAAWQQAADENSSEAYAAYLDRFPQGDYVSEARLRRRQISRQNAPPLPIRRYAYIGGGILALVLALWLGPQMLETRKSGLEMVEISGGAFIMGCKDGRDKDCYDNEKPAHSVNLSGFQIGKYEVTQADWRAVMGSDPPELYNKGCDDCPVEGVSWEDVQDFLKKLNAKYPGKNYHLPTEAEWEFAARGGSRSLDCQYSGSNNIDEVAWYEGNYKTTNSFGTQKTTQPVGQKKANELGLYDMTGNVWEWCSDWYDIYPKTAQTNPQGPGSGSLRVYRGGSWGYGSQLCRFAFRHAAEPAIRSCVLGFRLAAVSSF